MSLADYDELPLMAINSQRVTQIALINADQLVQN